MSTPEPVSVCVPLPYCLGRDETVSITAPLSRDGVAVVPVSASVSVHLDGLQVYTGAATSLSPPTAAIPSGLIDAKCCHGDRKLLVCWEFTLPDGTTLKTQHPAWVCGKTLQPVLSVDDVIRHCPALSPAGGSAGLDSIEQVQELMDDAWVCLNQWINQQGDRPHAIVDSYMLAKPHLLQIKALADERHSHCGCKAGPTFGEQLATELGCLRLSHTVCGNHISEPRSSGVVYWLGQ